MPLVEGLGDEVTVILGLLTIIIVLLIAWLSTHTRDIPFFSVIVVELSQRAARNQQSRSRTPENQQQAIQESDVSTTSPSVETLVAQHQDVESTKRSPLVNDNIGRTGDGVDTVHDTVHTLDNSSENQHSLPIGAQSEHNHDNVQSNEELDSVTKSKSVNNTTLDVNRTQSSEDSNFQSVSDTIAGEESISSKTVGSTLSEKNDNDSSEILPSIHETETQACPSTQNVSTDESDAAQLRHRHVPSTRSESGPASVATNPPTTSPTPPTPPTTPPTPQTINPTPPGTDTAQDFLDSANDDHMGQIRIRLKYLNDTQRLVYSSPTDTIGQFRRAHFSTELAANKLVRLIFNGQDMRNDTNTLQGYNITDNSVIHCLITQNLQGTAQTHTDNGDGDVQLGSFMMPLFAVILAAVWYLRITQRQYFNAVSTLSLAGVTFLFLLGCASVWRTGGNREHQHVD